MKNKKWTKLLSYYKPYKKELFLDLLFSIIYSIAVTSIPLLIRYVTTNIVNLEKDDVYRLLLLITGGNYGIICYCIFMFKIY